MVLPELQLSIIVPNLDRSEKIGVWPICTGNRHATKTSLFSPAVLDSASFLLISLGG